MSIELKDFSARSREAAKNKTDEERPAVIDLGSGFHNKGAGTLNATQVLHGFGWGKVSIELKDFSARSREAAKNKTDEERPAGIDQGELVP